MKISSASPSKRMGNRKRWLFLLAGIILLVGIVCMAVYLARVGSYQKAVKNMSFSAFDLSTVPDGVYTGSCNVDFVAATVEVTVQDGQMTDIRLVEHKNERGAPAERVIGEMLEQQRLEVDVVAGATNSSKVIRKAVENALTQSAQ